MRYSIRSDMMEEMTPKSPRLVRHVFLCRVWRVVSWFLLPIAYVGALIAPAGFLSIPFQVFHRHHYSPRAFWILTAVVGAIVLCMLSLAVISLLRHFRQRVIYVESVVLFVGFCLVLPIVFWVFPAK